MTHRKSTCFCAGFAAGRKAASAGFILLITTFVLAGRAAAVSEQAIGAASADREVSAPSAPETPEPTSSTTAQNPEAARPPSAPIAALPQQPHATFPYMIRPGDSLGSIANLFGVSLSELARVNRINVETELVAGRLIRIPNPAVAHERDLKAQIDQLEHDRQDATDRAIRAETRLTAVRANLQALTAEHRELSRDVRSLGWWRGATYVLAGLAFLLFGVMLLALIDWWMLRNRFRAVAEMNESLRRLDHKYKIALAKSELRLQELYGRRRRGLHEGQERPKLAEEAEIEALTRELKTVLEHHLQRLGPAGAGAQRAQWRERIARIGAPAEPRPVRR